MDIAATLVELDCFCGASFLFADDLKEHRRARGHFKSHVCHPLCKHPPYAPNPSPPRTCQTCGKVCQNGDIFKDHIVVTGHCYCAECNIIFSNPTALQKHLKSKMHASEFHCCDCDLDFKDLLGLELHLKGPRHGQAPKKKAAKKEKCPCTKCKRVFRSDGALQQHLTSVKHNPLSGLKCPLGKKCKKVFASPSALLHHLESGSCDSGMTRLQLDQLITATDSEWSMYSMPTPALSDTGSEWTMCSIPIPDISDTGSEWSLLTPDHSDGGVFLPAERSILSSVSKAAAPRLFKCPTCPASHKGFKTLTALETHMASPAHALKLYRCPISIITPEIGPGLQGQYKVFSTLSGLSQHIESGACKGGKNTFSRIMMFVQERLRGLGFRDISLLRGNAA
ncbi:uncharacterized protein K452DRAFT_236010 [Aplosporella prunicola CBS 121167]|uniref:C2H2-type domain-containing protein n=1 Tax=Aplosporella prunicola CBS 121167 TaxID=1176127 RepID=A0A6A6B2F6_9PEZI|nr:uncharacterized protein K452DRAFT_236010 [Aplosporella prunicola CBS 121167]KAF2137445.1 hypothetical protein K452DRAFT_236010 [Aplosporella prunicola CBS 121167]